MEPGGEMVWPVVGHGGGGGGECDGGGGGGGCHSV